MRIVVFLSLVAFLLAFGKGNITLKGPNDQALMVGNEAFFLCDVSDDATLVSIDIPFVITWTFQPADNPEVLSDVMTVTHRGGLRYSVLTPDPDKYWNDGSSPHLGLRNVQLSDAGRYTCKSNVTNPVLVGSNLMIVDRPKCHNEKPQVYFKQNISLECTVRYGGFRHPVVKWRFGSLQLNSTREIQENATTLKETLTFEASEKVRGHIYHCQVSYPGLLSVECLALPPIQVYVQSKVLALHVYPVLKDNTFPIGSNIMLHCIGTGYPTPTYMWRFTPFGSSSSDRISKTFTGTQLAITDFTESNAGLYECIISNEIGVDEKGVGGGTGGGGGSMKVYTDTRGVNISVAQGLTALVDPRNGDQNAAYIVSSKSSAQQISPQVADGTRSYSPSGGRTKTHTSIFSPYAVGAVVSAGMAVFLLVVFVFMALRMKKREKRMREKITRAHDEMLDDQEVELLDEVIQPASEYLPTEYSRLKMSWEIPRKDVRLLDQVGQGAFVEVWKGRMRRSPGSNEVMRVIIKKLQGEATEKEHHFFRAELEVLKMLPIHANVIRLVGSFTANEPWLMMMEQASDGSLQQFLQRHRPGHQQISFTRGDQTSISMKKQMLTPQKLLALAAQVASGLDHLEKFKIVYYRLRSCKILVANGGICKLSGFGFAKEMTERNIYEVNSLPVRWTAPESLKSKECNMKADTWAYGIVIWEILHFGTTPYPTMGPIEVVESVQTGFRMPKPQHCSTELYELLLRCWHTIPEERPSYQETLELLSSLVVNAHSHIDFGALPENLLSLGDAADL